MPCGLRPKLGDGDAGQLLNVGFQQVRHRCDSGVGYEHRHAGIPQDPGLAPQVVFDHERTTRWVQGDRDTAAGQDAEERLEVVRLRRQHDRHGAAWAY